MAPPERDETPQAGVYRDYLARVKLADNPRLQHNANLLASWVEWLLHPETHDYDRTVIYDDGTKREEDHRVTQANPAPGQFEPIEEDYESVIAGYDLSRFLDPMVAVASQRVEEPDGILAIGAAAIKNVWWLGNEHAISLATAFPPKEDWDSPAREAAKAFVDDLSEFATQVNKIADELHHMPARYAAIIRALRRNLDQAAAEVIAAFEKKFHEKPGGSFSLDIVGIVLSATAAAAVTYMTAGAALPLIETAIVTNAWSATFTQVFTEVLKPEPIDKIAGYWWRDLAKSYFFSVADIVTKATGAMNDLDTKIKGLLDQFKVEVEEFFGPGVV